MVRSYLELPTSVIIKIFSYGVRTVRRKLNLINRAIEPSVFNTFDSFFNRIVGD